MILDKLFIFHQQYLKTIRFKYYSYSRRTNNKFKEFKIRKNHKKRKIPFENTYIKQIIFNSKYYDMIILIKIKEPNIYSLAAIHATIKKDKKR